MPLKKINKGFTLLEILLVVGIIAVLAGIVIIAINPARQLATVRNTERKSDLKQINNALQQFYIDKSYYPASTTLVTTLTEICDTGTATSTHTIDCTDLIDLSELVPTYITAIPTDPQGSTLSFIPKVYATTNGTGYKIGVDANNKVILTAPQAELGVMIAVGTTTVPTSEGLCDAICQALRVGLVAYYPMDTDLNDYAGSNDGTNHSITPTIGIMNGGYSFGGGYVSFPSFSSLDATSTFSFSLWIYPTVLTGVKSWITKFQDNNNYITFMSSGADVYVVVANAAPASYGYAGTLSLNQWQHVVMVYNGAGSENTDKLKLYIDGVSKSLTFGGNISITTPNLSGYQLQFGIRNASNYAFSGVMDEVTIYSRAITVDEILDHYNSGTGRSLMTE